MSWYANVTVFCAQAGSDAASANAAPTISLFMVPPLYGGQRHNAGGARPARRGGFGDSCWQALERGERLAQDVGHQSTCDAVGDQRRRDDRAVAGGLEVEAVREQLLLEDLSAPARRAVRVRRRSPPSFRSRGCRRRPGCPSARRARRGSTATARARARTGPRSGRCRAWRGRRRRTPDGPSTCSRGRTRSRLRARAHDRVVDALADRHRAHRLRAVGDPLGHRHDVRA